jgi:UDPglucose--hexose-1-phosphate uridylyltransferase
MLLTTLHSSPRMQDHPHRRFNPLTGEWILVSPRRTRRPWQGEIEPAQLEHRLTYDPKCYLCPGNQRASGMRNPTYTDVFAFDNDFAALAPNIEIIPGIDHPLIKNVTVQGICRVLCFSPQHDLTLPLMATGEIRKVVDLWAREILELGARYRWVQVFENKGEIMGCSNPHPHGQIWAGTSLPNEPSKEDEHQRSYTNEFNSILLLDYLEFEMEQRTRAIVENDHWVVVVPFWAVWPFETILLPRRHVLRLPDLTQHERDALAEILKRLLTRYDNLFNTSFPYTMGWHGAPHGPEGFPHWQLHAHFYPPLLRSATVKKFMVGYEMLSEPQRDITPEQAAEQLQSVSDIHYTVKEEESKKSRL